MIPASKVSELTLRSHEQFQHGFFRVQPTSWSIPLPLEQDSEMNAKSDEPRKYKTKSVLSQLSYGRMVLLLQVPKKYSIFTALHTNSSQLLLPAGYQNLIKK